MSARPVYASVGADGADGADGAGEASSISARAMAAAMSWTSRMSFGSSSCVTPAVPGIPLSAVLCAACCPPRAAEVGSGVSVRKPIRKAFRATLSPSAMSRLLLGPALRCARGLEWLGSDASDGGTGNVPRW
jgi:hypothetical protein